MKILTRITRWRRCLLIGMPLLLMAAFMVRMSASGETASEVPCGLGLPPDAPGFAQQQVLQRAEEQRDGFRRVCEAALARYDLRFVPVPVATAGLDFTPVALDATPLAAMTALGARSESVSGVDAILYRGFRTADGSTLTLSEHDMSADGTRSWRDPNDEPERVNGLPARLTVLEARPGRSVSVLSWKEGRRWFELWWQINASRDPARAQLFALAASLPRSTPACPNEQLGEEPSLGPDGRPVIADMPQTLTEADLKAMDTKRSCQ
jgi:hypothetical protein